MSAQRPLRLQGFVLLSTLWVVIFLMLVGVSLFTRGLWQSATAAHVHNRSSALYAAEAAVDQAAQNLRTAETSDDIGVAPEWADLPSGRFTIAPPFAVTGSLYRVRTTGESGSEQRELEVILRLTPESIFQYALFGDQGMTVSGSAITDSYDSSLGAYNDDPESPDYNAGHHGDIGTNAIAEDIVQVWGSIFIDGQVAVGYGVDDPTSVIDGYDPDVTPAFITGGTSPPSDTQDVITQESVFPMPSVTVPDGLTCVDRTISGHTVETLSPTGGQFGDGVYCYRDLTIQGGGELTASGPVTVYIVGQLTAQGNSVMGVQSDPTQMLVKMAPTSEATLEQGALTGSSRFYGAMYAPDSTIRITGNADVYGSIIAKSLNVSGSASVHYDEAMVNQTQVSNTFAVSRFAWREL